MNRELRFRVWDGYSMEVFGLQDLYWRGEDIGDYDFPKGLPAMKYTGLKDKNGVEIYEGDIVKSYRITEGIVKYGDCSGGGPDEGFRTMGFYVEDGCFEKGLLDIDPIEVIGNVWENRELLDDSK